MEVHDSTDVTSDSSGERFIYVLRGQVTVLVGNESFDLATGEAACYDGTQPHWVRPRVPIVGNGEAPLVLQIFVP